MEKPEIKFNVIAVDGKPIALEIREGKAPDIREKSKVVLNSNIYGVREYILKHYDILPGVTNVDFEGEKILPGIIIIDIKDNTASIVFDEKPGEPVDGVKIISKLLINPDLEAFELNKENMMTGKQLISKIRKLAHCFGSLDKARELIKSLQNIEVAFETIVADSDDRKGNIEMKLKQEMKFRKGEIPSNLELQIPIFTGTPPISLPIEIEIESKGAAASYGFYCLGVEERIRQHARDIIGGQITPEIAEMFVVLHAN